MRRQSPAVIAFIFFIILDAMAFYAAYVNRNREISPVALTAMAPMVVWKDFKGASHTLKELGGHVVVLHFWASWCPPCREEFPKILQYASQNPDVIILTVSSDDKLEPALQFTRMVPDVTGIKSPPNVLYAWDQTKTITYDQFLTARYPESIFIDPTGHMRRKYPIAVEWDSKDVQDYINELKKAK